MGRNYRLSETTLLTASLSPTTLQQAISKFLTNLQLSDTQSEKVKRRHKSLRERVELFTDFPVEKSILYGSYPRYSQIKPRSTDSWKLDVDVLLIVKHTDAVTKKYFYNNDGGTKLLGDVFEAIDGYQGLDIELDAPSISVKWKDEKMKIEITPAFRRSGGGFLIPGRYSWLGWQSTDPISDSSVLSTANSLCDYELKPLIKMLKCWNRNFHNPLSSFGVETALYHSTKNYSDQGIEFELPYFFSQLRNKYDGNSLKTPSGVGDAVGINLGWKKIYVESAEKATEESFKLAARGYQRSAIEKMATVFGYPFPTASTSSLTSIWS